MSPIIQLQGLTKFYGQQRGVVNLDMEVKPGAIFGYLGPNGAGKTTTIRLLLDIIRPTKGVAKILDLDCQTDSLKVRQRVGYLSGEPALYGNLTGNELLSYCANLKGGVDWRNVEGLAHRLQCDLTRTIQTLSHGNRQKVAMIRAFMHEPELLILDEPTSGLDPLIQQEFENILREVKAEGRTVFLSSHVLPEVEELCDTVGIVREGRLIMVEDVATLKSRRLRGLEVRFGGPVPQEAFAHLGGVQNVKVAEDLLRCDIVGSLDAFVKTAGQFEVVDMKIREPSLEEVFLAYYGGESSSNA
ncbi:MAG: ABC transporter ATP-binding protein [Chloroflexota bacterium]